VYAVGYHCSGAPYYTGQDLADAKNGVDDEPDQGHFAGFMQLIFVGGHIRKVSYL
jgi:hypothetical protein